MGKTFKKTIIISSVVLLFVLAIINSCNGRKFYKTHTENIVTILDAPFVAADVE